jgi:hypothetical protein
MSWDTENVENLTFLPIKMSEWPEQCGKAKGMGVRGTEN